MANIDKIQLGNVTYDLAVKSENIIGDVPVDLQNYYNKQETYNKNEVYNKTETYNKQETDTLVDNASKELNDKIKEIENRADVNLDNITSAGEQK